jgi:hypothetical protein
MGSLGISSQKSIQFFNVEHKHVAFLMLLHAITLIGYDVKVSLEPSGFPFGKISVQTT